MIMEPSASDQIDAIIAGYDGWKHDQLAQIRAVVTAAPGIVEDVKWKKPSRPEGVPVWTHDGKNICIAEALKNAVRVTFPSGAQLSDPTGLFNTRLDSKSVRAVDFSESDAVDAEALEALVTQAVSILGRR
jgi:hypothetical protein